MTEKTNPAAHTEVRFHDDEAARQHLEAIRWPSGPICPHCGGTGRNVHLEGKSHRPGLLFCGDCRTQFSVTVGTVFERSKIALHKWVYATHLMCASKKGISSKQLERVLGVTYKTAWFMSHRIREAMKPASTPLLGGGGGTIEADETFVGRKPNRKKRAGPGHKEAVFSLVERGGHVRSFHVLDVTGKTLKAKLREHVSKEANMMTDEATHYKGLKNEFNSHDTVTHSLGEYVRDDTHTNTIEGFFSIFKRGIIGTYQRVSHQHLHRYTAEFDFRYNNREKLGVNDAQRADNLLKGIAGKRLTYRRTDANQEALAN